MLQDALRSVAPQVFQVRVRLASVFLLLDRRVTIIDTGVAGSAPRILRALRLLGRSADEVDHILITHYHLDHAGGLAGLQRFVPGRTGVHAVEAPHVRGELPLPWPYQDAPAERRLRPLRRIVIPPARVDTLLQHGDELPVLGGLRVIHTPGHTPGHIALHLPERGVLIAGDALQVRAAHRIIPPARLVTEDWPEALRSIRRLAGVDFDTLALSHFPPQRHDARERLLRLADAVERDGAATPARRSVARAIRRWSVRRLRRRM
jgi:glyoxylase-like metal-dependent hydrolase (beta-lactamase superfamily II)